MRGVLFTFVFFTFTLYANEAQDIMSRVDKNLRGSSVYMKMSMSIHSFGHTRKIELQSWSEGSKRSFVKILYPPKERGITFLSLNTEMWQYIPKIERVIKIPPSMMLQNWMGSDITNDDVVKQSSIIDDYTPKILKKDASSVTIELIPKEDAAVVWGKIITTIDTVTYTGIEDIFYDEEGEVVRRFSYADVKKVGAYYVPMHWKIEPYNKKESFTTIEIEEVQYDGTIPQAYFSKSALKRFSR